MSKSFIADAATMRAEKLDREATKFLLDHQSTESKAKAEAKRKADALNRTAALDERAGGSINVERISAESLAGEVICGGHFEHQENAFAKTERKVERKRRARLEATGLSAHTEQALRKEVYGLEQAIMHPESDAELKLCVARTAYIWKILGAAKIFETRVAPLLGGSKRQAERYAEEGREIWANLIQIAIGRLVDPTEALPYLATLSQSLQLEVAHEVERQKETWVIQHQIALHARAPKLDHGTLDALPHKQLCEPDTRRELSLLEAPARAKRIAQMRLDERNAATERERKATTRDRERDARFAAINTNLGGLLVQTFTTASAADRDYFLTVMDLAPISAAAEWRN